MKEARKAGVYVPAGSRISDARRAVTRKVVSREAEAAELRELAEVRRELPREPSSHAIKLSEDRQATELRREGA